MSQFSLGKPLEALIALSMLCNCWQYIQQSGHSNSHTHTHIPFVAKIPFITKQSWQKHTFQKTARDFITATSLWKTHSDHLFRPHDRCAWNTKPTSIYGLMPMDNYAFDQQFPWKWVGANISLCIFFIPFLERHLNSL